MKRTLMMLCATFALAGCNQGGTGDQYSTGTGRDMSTNATTSVNAPPPVVAPASSSFSNANPSLAQPNATPNTDVTRPGEQSNPSKQP